MIIAQMGPGTGGSESQSSISSLKEGLHRVIGGSPPPPYEVFLFSHSYTLQLTTYQRFWNLLFCKIVSGGDDKAFPKDERLMQDCFGGAFQVVKVVNLLLFRSPSPFLRHIIPTTLRCLQVFVLETSLVSKQPPADEQSTKPCSPTSLPPRPSISSLGAKVFQLITIMWSPWPSKVYCRAARYFKSSQIFDASHILKPPAQVTIPQPTSPRPLAPTSPATSLKSSQSHGGYCDHDHGEEEGENVQRYLQYGSQWPNAQI